jgi:peptidoglycan/xylan/chitin deacetylase (PgdA/CDA1 family)
VSGDGAEPEGTVSAARLRRHLRYLKRHFRLISLSDAVASLATPGALTEDMLVVTFDDGCHGNYAHAWPVLRSEGVPATVFVTTAFVDGHALWFDVARRALQTARTDGGRLPEGLERDLVAAVGATQAAGAVEDVVEALKRLPAERREALVARMADEVSSPLAPARALSWAEVREMGQAGLEIGCHTVSHPILAGLPPRRQEEEILGSAARIEAETGVRPTLFAYPNGTDRDFDRGTTDILRAGGFRAACTTLRGSNRPGCDPFTLRRVGVGAEPSFVLAARLAGAFDEEVRALLTGVGRAA